MKAIIFLMFLVAWLPSILVGQKVDVHQLDDYLQREMNSCQIPGMAVGIVRDGEIMYCKGFGKNVGDQAPMTAESPFMLASLTKSFTALAISQLESQGKLNYTDTVKDHLPFFSLKDAEYDDAITINHLLDHRSGIPGISRMICMWYLATYWMTSLHLAQPDILLMIQVFFASSLLVGLLKLNQLRRAMTRKNV